MNTIFGILKTEFSTCRFGKQKNIQINCIPDYSLKFDQKDFIYVVNNKVTFQKFILDNYSNDIITFINNENKSRTCYDENNTLGFNNNEKNNVNDLRKYIQSNFNFENIEFKLEEFINQKIINLKQFDIKSENLSILKNIKENIKNFYYDLDKILYNIYFIQELNSTQKNK